MLMKKILTIFAAAAIATAAYAQKIENSVPVAVFVPESVDNVPESSRILLETKLNALTSKCGMGTAELTQFYLTCYANVIDKQVIPGASNKFVNEVELTVAVVDALGKRTFDACGLNLKGAGNSDQKAFNAAFRNLKITDQKLTRFMAQTNDKIISYYVKSLRLSCLQNPATMRKPFSGFRSCRMSANATRRKSFLLPWTSGRNIWTILHIRI